MFPPKKKLPLDALAAIKSLIFVLAPPVRDLDLPNIEETIIHQMTRMVHEFPVFFRWGYCLGLMLFEWLPFLFGFGSTRFSKLSIVAQNQYTASWAHSRWVPLREFFKAIKGLIFMIYFSDPRVWAYIGYDPKPHMAERIKMREGILYRTS